MVFQGAEGLDITRVEHPDDKLRAQARADAKRTGFGLAMARDEQDPNQLRVMMALTPPLMINGQDVILIRP